MIPCSSLQLHGLPGSTAHCIKYQSTEKINPADGTLRRNTDITEWKSSFQKCHGQEPSVRVQKCVEQNQ